MSGDYRDAVGELVAAIDAIVAAWDGGDLAGAVNNARVTADDYREDTTMEGMS